MATPDAGLNIPYAFNADQFRDAITFAAQMGAPPDPALRAKFVKPVTGKTYWKDGVELSEPPLMGRDGQPLDADVEVRRPDPEIVEDANCAIEIERVTNVDELPVGKFLNTRAVVTLLDVDYAKIQGCKEMRYNGDRYAYGYEPEALGLFDVGVHTVIYYAIDES